MLLPGHEQLDTIHLQRLFDNMSECYKLFWFQAIVEQIYAGKTVLTYDELINNMIADAWYMVTEYKLNLGPADNLEDLVHYAQNLFGLISSEKKSTILDAVENSSDRELLRRKQILTYNVPYRLQAPFMHDFKGKVWDCPKGELTEKINSYSGLLYRFDSLAGLQSAIVIDEKWSGYITSNYEIILGWIQYNMIQYLQRRNPSVPGIPNKLAPPRERNLEKVKKYWKTVLDVSPMHDIYGDILLEPSGISIDHFIPWSYVAHDELWNLHPTTRSINSSKSNNLPDWDRYFSRLCDTEYKAYEAMWKFEPVHASFDRCAKEHINSTDVMHKLYRPGLTSDVFTSMLEEIIHPVYNAALNLGFHKWTL